MSNEMPLLAHLNELRKRILWCLLFIGILSSGALLIYPTISSLFLTPFNTSIMNGASINVNSIYEGFFVKIKLSILSGCIASLPIIVFQTCRFVLPGLKKNEKKWLFIIIFFSSFLSIGSTYLGYAIVFPYIVSYLLTTSFIPETIQILLNYQENVSYIISFLAGSIIIFQSPIILTVLLAKNILKRHDLIKNARWFIIGIIIISAIATPPDIFSQLSLSVPLMLCFFGCIIFAKFMGWGDDRC